MPAASELWGTNPHEASLSVNIPGATMSMNAVISPGSPYRFGPYTIGILEANKETATIEIKKARIIRLSPIIFPSFLYLLSISFRDAMIRKIFFLLALTFLLAFSFAQAGLPNPASVFCESQGYTLEIREGEGGQYGVCVFPSGECDEWKYFRGECLGPGDTGMRPPQDSFGQNLSSCDQFRDAEVCPSLWQPVCANIEKEIPHLMK